MLFADVCGSTSLSESLGDDLAHQALTRCIGIMTSKITAYHGTLIKTIGDEVMATFPTAEAAFHAACIIQAAVENDRPVDGTPLYVRIGFNYGEVTLEGMTLEVKPNEHVYVPQGTKHRIRNTGTEKLEFIEVQLGTYFGEDDIKRYSDDFGRV